MTDNLDKFDSINAVDENENYDSNLIDLSFESINKPEEPEKKLHTMSASTNAIVEKFASLDDKYLGDVVRAAVYLLKNASDSEREEAYKATQVLRNKPGKKKSGAK